VNLFSGPGVFKNAVDLQLSLTWPAISSFPVCALPQRGPTSFTPGMGDTMIVLYSALLLVLTVSLFFVKRRAATLERRHARFAREAAQFAKEPTGKEAGYYKHDPCQNAKRQYLLGLLVQKRDRVEARYTAWQGFAEKFEARVKGLRTWKGKKLPYTFGVLDVAGLFYLLDYVGLGQYANVRNLVTLVTNYFAG
jgi:hypothetical protein